MTVWKMASVRQQQGGSRRSRRVITGTFPNIRDSELRRFRERCGDPDDVADFATGIRRLAKKYEDIDDDYELCVLFLKEKHIENINENFRVALPTVSLVGNSVLSVHPNVQVVLTGLTTNSTKISEWISYIYEPDYTIADREDNDSEGALIPIPRDEVTLRDMRRVLGDCKVPTSITGGIVEMFSKGVGMKTILATVQTVALYFIPGSTQTTVNSSTLAEALGSEF
jgi:hypothetical protein